MEKDKKIKIGLLLVFIAASLGLLFFLGSLTYYIKGIIGGGRMFGEAIHQSELSASKQDESKNAEVCLWLKKKLESEGKNYLDDPRVKDGSCPK